MEQTEREPSNFTESLKKLITTGRDIISCLSVEHRSSPPYWVRCLDLFANAVNLQIVERYQKENVPDDQRFEKLKMEFQNLYRLFEDDVFSKELLYEENGIKKFHDEWLTIDSNASTYSGLSYNRGLSIVITKKINSKGCDIELPLSEIFNAAISVRALGFKKPHYPLSVIYGIYKCISFSVPEHHQMIDKISAELFELTLKDKSEVNKNIKKAKNFIKPLLDLNKDIIGNLVSQVNDGINELDDEHIDTITIEAQKHMKKMENGSESFQSLLSSYMPGSDIDPAKKMEELGLDDSKIKSLIDRAESGGMTNEELFSSIPSLANLSKK